MLVKHRYGNEELKVGVFGQKTFRVSPKVKIGFRQKRIGVHPPLIYSIPYQPPPFLKSRTTSVHQTSPFAGFGWSKSSGDFFLKGESFRTLILLGGRKSNFFGRLKTCFWSRGPCRAIFFSRPQPWWPRAAITIRSAHAQYTHPQAVFSAEFASCTGPPSGLGFPPSGLAPLRLE